MSPEGVVGNDTLGVVQGGRVSPLDHSSPIPVSPRVRTKVEIGKSARGLRRNLFQSRGRVGRRPEPPTPLGWGGESKGSKTHSPSSP